LIGIFYVNLRKFLKILMYEVLLFRSRRFTNIARVMKKKYWPASNVKWKKEADENRKIRGYSCGAPLRNHTRWLK